MTTIGIAGLGLMGQAFASRLQAAHYEVRAFDVNPERGENFGAEHLCTSAHDLANQCGVVILCVFNTDQVDQVIFGPQGLLVDNKNNGLKIICTSTCDPEQIEDIAQRCMSVGSSFLELPMSGTSLQVSRGDGVGLMGGAVELCDELSEILDVMCPTRHHIGTVGDANRAKLAVNLVLGLHRASLAEGLNFGQRLGLDPARLLHVLEHSAAASSVMPIKGPLMVRREYHAPQSRVDQSLKDFGLIQGLGAKIGQKLPMTDVYIKLMQSCLNRGEGHLDNAIIYEAIFRGEI